MERFIGRGISYSEDEHGDLLYRVLEGAARVVIDKDRETEKTLTELTAGQFFGELSAIGGYPRSATVVAAADGTRLAELTVEDMGGYFKEDPDAVLELLKYFGSRIHELSDDYEEARKALSALKTAGDKPCAEGFLQKDQTVRELLFRFRQRQGNPQCRSQAGRGEKRRERQRRQNQVLPLGNCPLP